MVGVWVWLGPSGVGLVGLSGERSSRKPNAGLVGRGAGGRGMGLGRWSGLGYVAGQIYLSPDL
jgi:hypothetical protein